MPDQSLRVVRFHHHCYTCLLKASSLCCNLSDDQVRKLASLSKQITYRKNQTLFVEGEPSARIFVIRKGTVKLSRSSPDGRELLLQLKGSGTLTGFHALFLDQYAVTATACGTVEVCLLRSKDVLDAVAEDPTFLQNLVKLCQFELVEAWNQLITFATAGPRSRVATLLLKAMPESTGESGAPVEVALPVSRRNIAEWLNIAPETLSRILSEFENNSMIMRMPGRRLAVSDAEKLRGVVTGANKKAPKKNKKTDETA
jgi:CRP-like cAMP-binding protein